VDLSWLLEQGNGEKNKYFYLLQLAYWAPTAASPTLSVEHSLVIRTTDFIKSVDVLCYIRYILQWAQKVFKVIRIELGNQFFTDSYSACSK
jgi:hypothetical protein